MSVPPRDLSARSLAELALVISRIVRTNIDGTTVLSSDVLRTLWQSTRSLEYRWTQALHEWTSAGTQDLDRLTELAPRVFTIEMLVRIWSTAVVGSDRDQGRDDATRLAQNAVHSLTRVRNGVLARLLSIPDDHYEQIAAIDKLRRRCERWTDVLIGCMAVRFDCFDFACEVDRARDFSTESMSADPPAGPNVAEHFVSAGLRLNFVRNLPATGIDEPEIVELLSSILSSIPATSFHRDGTLRTLLEQRIVNGRRQSDRAFRFHYSPFIGGSDAST